MYQARVLELKQLILAEEARFRSVLLYYYIYPVGLAYFLVSRSVAAEIEAIRAGKWDAQIERRLGSVEYVTDRIALSSQSDVCVFYLAWSRAYSTATLPCSDLTFSRSPG